MKKLMLASAICSAITGATLVAPVTAMASPAIATAVAVEAAKNILPNVEVETRMFSPSFDTKVHSDSINYNGGDVSLKDDLGFDNKKGPEFIVRYRNMSLDWIHASSSGNATLKDDLKIDGKTFSKGSGINSDSDINYVKFTVNRPIMSTPLAGATWNYGIAALNWKLSANGEVTATATGQTATTAQSASEDYTVPIPMVGVGGAATLAPGLGVYANISGLPLASYGHIYDLETGLTYQPVPNLSVRAGYRKIDINVHKDDDRGNFRLAGPFVGFSYSF